jgi:hypothetical protein
MGIYLENVAYVFCGRYLFGVLWMSVIEKRFCLTAVFFYAFDLFLLTKQCM